MKTFGMLTNIHVMTSSTQENVVYGSRLLNEGIL